MEPKLTKKEERTIVKDIQKINTKLFKHVSTNPINLSNKQYQ